MFRGGVKTNSPPPATLFTKLSSDGRGPLSLIYAPSRWYFFARLDDRGHPQLVLIGIPPGLAFYGMFFRRPLVLLGSPPSTTSMHFAIERIRNISLLRRYISSRTCQTTSHRTRFRPECWSNKGQLLRLSQYAYFYMLLR